MYSYRRLQISRTEHMGSELLKSCYLAVPWPAGKFHREELVVGSGFTQMPRLLPRISDPHRPTLIRINDEEHGLQVCRQETGWCERELWDLAMDWGMCIRGLGRRTRAGSELPLLAWMGSSAGSCSSPELHLW